MPGVIPEAEIWLLLGILTEFWKMAVFHTLTAFFYLANVEITNTTQTTHPDSLPHFLN